MEDIARSITNSAVSQREESFRTRHTINDARFQTVVDHRTSTCPCCGQGLRKRVVEHPRRQLGLEGQTVVFCHGCGLAKVFDFCIDDGRAIGDEHIAGVTGRPRGTAVLVNGGRIEAVRRV